MTWINVRDLEFWDLGFKKGTWKRMETTGIIGGI